MIINRHTLHCLLVDYPQASQGFFASTSKVRLGIEKIRGNLTQRGREHYRRMYLDLDEQEMAELIQVLKTYIATNRVSDMTSIDHRMVHKLMCDNLLAYELDNIEQDSFRKVVDVYFFKLNKELHPEEKKSLTVLDIWLQHVVDNPHLYIGHLFIAWHANEYIFKQLDLNECGCVDVSHDRLLSDLRLQIEKQVLEQCEKFHITPKNPLKILSLGPGEGLQDFIIVFKLFSMGIRNIELSLVETNYNSLLDPKEESVQIWQKGWHKNDMLPMKYRIDHQKALYGIIRALSLLAKSFNDTHLTIYQYHSVDSLKNDKRRSRSFDVIHAIDFEDYVDSDSNAYRDFHALADCMSSDGTAILSHHYCIEQFKPVKEKDEIRLKQIAVTKFKRVESEEGGYKVKHPMKSFF